MLEISTTVVFNKDTSSVDVDHVGSYGEEVAAAEAGAADPLGGPTAQPVLELIKCESEDIHGLYDVLPHQRAAHYNTRSAAPFAILPTIASPKSKAKKQREYRQRRSAFETRAQSKAARKSNAENQRNYRLRKAAELALARGSFNSTTVSTSGSGARSNDAQTAATASRTTQSEATRKANAEKQRNYRLRKAAKLALVRGSFSFNAAETANDAQTAATASRTTQSEAMRKYNAEKQRNYRLRKAAKLALVRGSFKSTTVSTSGSGASSNDAQTGIQQLLTADNPAMADQTDESMDLTDLPLPSMSNLLTEAQDAAASTPATPFAEPPTIAATTSGTTQSKATRKSNAEYQRDYRLRKAAKLALVRGSFKSTTVSTSGSGVSSNDAQTGIQQLLTADNHATADQTDESMDLTDLPLPSMSNLLTEAQDAAASTPATPFAEPPTIAATASRTTQSIATRKSNAEYQRNYRLRKAAKLALARGSFESTTVSTSGSGASSNDAQTGIQQLLTADNPAMADQTDESMDLTDLPLPSMSNLLTEAQDAAASTPATPFAEPPTIAATASGTTQSKATRKSNAENQRNYRLRKAAKLDLARGSFESTTVSTSGSGASSNDAQTGIQQLLTADNPAMADQTDESMDLTDLPKSSISSLLTEAQDAVASTSLMPFAEPPTIAVTAPETPAQLRATRKSNAERQRDYRLRKAAKLASVRDSLDLATAVSSRLGTGSNNVQTSIQRQFTHQQLQSLAAEPAQITVPPGTSSDQIGVQQAQSTWKTKWASSILRFKSTFLYNDFGYACSVCDKLWFKYDLKPISVAQLDVISEWYIKENLQLCREEYKMVCNTCKRSLNKNLMPLLAKVNGFSYPDQPPDLPPLDPISERLISPHLPFMQVRRLRHDCSCGIIGQAINVPVDEQEIVKCLPRQLNEDDVINVNIEQKLSHKTANISDYLSTTTISAWLTVLQKSPLYHLYEINVDLSRLHPEPVLDNIQDDPSKRIENISAENTPESEILAARQHTMLWNEEDCLNIATGHQETLNTIYDRHAEELSFPSIYFGEPRKFDKGVSVTPYMIASSEIRRRDRRGATPQKILYVAMKILRMRMVDAIYSTFRNVSITENVTQRMLEDTEFLKEYVIQNLAFMKTVPNSDQYYASRKRDLFAVIRQLGKPTVFLTISANEIRWTNLLTILLKLSKKYPGKTAEDLNTTERCTLVNDDPVTCCIYFYRLVGSLMKMLKSKQCYNPFGKYFVKDYFLHIEFQPRGSPHAHMLLWLNDDPRETVSEDMPRTIELVEKLSSVDRDDVPNDSVYANQIHEHTSTCTKRGQTTCGLPYWPMQTTRVLVPIPLSDGRLQTLQQKAEELRTSLSEHRYASMDGFLNANDLTYDSYLDIVRSTLRKPTLVFRRNFDQLKTNTFNPYLAGEVNSSVDIQFILDEYSCAEYIVEHVNKSARGTSNLRRELTTMVQESNQDYTGQLKALSMKLLNAVEMSAQEAAWYLLRQPTSETSRQVVYVPTVWPNERQRCRKRRQQMDREGIDGDSTDVWTKNIIQRYEKRPESLEEVCLAEFASWYADANDFVDEDDTHVDNDGDSEVVPEAKKTKAPKEYRRRLVGRVIRYRHYDIDETVDYKREMVLLYVQFRNEISEIVDQNKFLRLFDDNIDTIMERRGQFDTNSNIENVTKELEATCSQNDDKINLKEEESRIELVKRLSGDDSAENVAYVNQIPQEFPIVNERSNVMKTRVHRLLRIMEQDGRLLPRKRFKALLSGKGAKLNKKQGIEGEGS